MGKNDTEKLEQLNGSIIEMIMEFSDYIEQDPMSLFYCLFFCIFYNNPTVIAFLRTLISKWSSQDRPKAIETIIYHIDQNGIERLRTIGDTINTQIYHMVFY